MTAVVVLIVATFALYGIGSPLLGWRVFGGTDLLGGLSAYRDAGLVGVSPHTLNLGDTVDAAIPNAALFGDALRHGHFAGWNPYVLGGGPLASTPNYAMLSPLSLPFWFLPTGLALAYAKLLEILCVVGAGFLYLRRIRLGRPAAWLGGLAFAGSGFMVAWTGWPQTKVAALIPAFFWALEVLIQSRRPRAVVLLALPVTAMLLGGFPSVTGYTLLTGAVYLVVRLLAEYRRQWLRIAWLLGGAALGVVAGGTLAAVQLVPWARFMSHALITNRVYESRGHIPFAALVTSIAPYALGSPTTGSGTAWFGPRIFIEEVAYVGAAGVLLILVALLMARRAVALLPAGTFAGLLAGGLGWAVLIFAGGPPLSWLQAASVLFSQNFIGRARSVLGFLLAVLAAVGFELLLRGYSRLRPERGRLAFLVRWWPGAALALVGLAGGVAYDLARQEAGAAHRVYLNRQLLLGLGFVAAAALCAAWLWWAPRPSGRRGRVYARRVGYAVAAAGLPVLLGSQGLLLARDYYPRTDPATFYPPTGGETYLTAHLGHQRYFGVPGAVLGGTGAVHGLRGLQGHAFVDRRFGELLEALPGKQFRTPPTSVSLDPQQGTVLHSPILDTLAVSYYVVPQDVVPYGQPRVDPGDGTAVTVQSGQTLTFRVPGRGPFRAIGLTPRSVPGPVSGRTGVTVSLRDRRGVLVASAERLAWSMAPDRPFFVPLAAEAGGAGAPYTVDLTLHAGTSWTVAARNRMPAISTVTAIPDGLKLVSDDGAAVYQRLTALPRARWASQVIVQPDPDLALALLANGAVGPDEVLLDSVGPPASGQPAQVRWLTDGLDRMTLSVQAGGSGYLVLADALGTGWRATVDRHPARLVPADHGLVAVAVPAGHHVVRLAYADAYGGPLGIVLSGLSALLLVGLVLLDRWVQRRRPAEPGGALVPVPRKDSAAVARRDAVIAARHALSRGRPPRE